MVEQQRLERVAVVGGGLAGLAAGMELAQRGVQVELFERSRLLGGRATSFEVDGVEVDNGQHVFLGCCSAFIDFVARADMAHCLHLQDRFDALVLARDGTSGRLRAAPWLPAPLHLTPSFAAYPHLTLDGKLRVARALTSALFARDYTTASLDCARDDRAATFDSWLRATGQNAATRRAFWDPFFIPALNAPFDRVPLADALFVLETAFLRDASAARFGFSTVPLAHVAAAAARQLAAVHLSTPISAIDAPVTPSEPVVTLSEPVVTLSLSKGGTAAFDGVVVATPPPATAKLLGDAGRYGIDGLDAFEPYPILDVHLWHDAGGIGFDFAAALESPLQWIFEKAPGYLACSFSAADEYMRVPTAQLQALAWREVQTFVPALRDAQLIRAAVTRNPDATYLPAPGARRPLQKTAVPNVVIAGAWTQTGWPDTMESAVRSGQAAARTLLAASAGAAPSLSSRAAVVA